MKYPQPKFKGRGLLFEEIKKVFEETPSNNDINKKLPQGEKSII